VLILDEPTAVLAPREAEELGRTVRALAADGRGVIFISHKLREVLAVADRIAVLRRGKLVQVTRASETSPDRLAQAVMGSISPASPTTTSMATPAATSTKAPLLVARDLRCDSDRGRPALRGLSFHIAPGEILGVAGVEGNGQSELAEVLTGLRRAQGSLLLADHDGLVAGGWARSAAGARAHGIVHLPEDRHRRALCLPLTMEENFALGRQREPPYARGGLIDRAGRNRKARELIAAFDVRPPDPLVRAADLSGGNQQKLVAARELRGGPLPRLVVAMHPTRGLDPGAANRVHDALRAERADGAAALLISLDLDELRALSHRILVLFEGRAAGEAAPTANDESLGRMMLGQAG